MDARTVAFLGAATIYQRLTRAWGGIWTVATGVWEEAVDATNVQAHVRRMAGGRPAWGAPDEMKLTVSILQHILDQPIVFAVLLHVGCSLVRTGPYLPVWIVPL